MHRIFNKKKYLDEDNDWILRVLQNSKIQSSIRIYIKYKKAYHDFQREGHHSLQLTSWFLISSYIEKLWWQRNNKFGFW